MDLECRIGIDDERHILLPIYSTNTQLCNEQQDG
jgi:hypothetical protein